MIITKKQFEEITDKVIAETKKEAGEKINGFNLDIEHPEETKQVQKTVNKMFQLYYKGIALELFEDSDEKEITLEEFARAASKYAGIVKQIEKSPIERELYEIVLITNSKKVFDEIFGEEGNEWLKKECEQL